MSAGSLVLFGAGNMGGAILEGLLEAGPDSPPIVIAPRPTEQIAAHAEAETLRLNDPAEPAGILIIAIKPQVFRTLTATLQEWVDPETLVISVMAGIGLSTLSSDLGTDKVIRVMPNTPGAIGQGVSLLSPGLGVSANDVEVSMALLAPLGHVEGPMKETTLQAATGLSGCGPAYVFLLAESLAAAAERQGVPGDMAMRLATATIAGSAALMAGSESAPEDLRRAVTSPNGVTQAALDVLMDEPGLPSLFRRALEAAVKRDRELSREAEKD
ncbi:MAG: pyrroline-5-carboxylate reductase [Pseudomonadota bacterium]